MNISMSRLWIPSIIPPFKHSFISLFLLFRKIHFHKIKHRKKKFFGYVKWCDKYKRQSHLISTCILLCLYKFIHKYARSVMSVDWMKKCMMSLKKRRKESLVVVQKQTPPSVLLWIGERKFLCMQIPKKNALKTKNALKAWDMKNWYDKELTRRAYEERKKFLKLEMTFLLMDLKETWRI